MEERTKGIMQNTYNLLQVCVHTTYRSFLIHMTWLVADSPNLFCTAPLPRTLNFLRQYVLHVLFVFPAPVPYGALGHGFAKCVNHSHSFTSHILDRDRIVVPAGWNS